MATQIMLRRNVPAGIAPREAEPVAQETAQGWVLKVGDGSTPVESLPVMAGPGAYTAMETFAAETLAAVQRAEDAAESAGVHADRAQAVADVVAAGAATFTPDPQNPGLMIVTFPSFMLAEDGNSIVVPVSGT